jgi:hypothetical protein
MPSELSEHDRGAGMTKKAVLLGFYEDFDGKVCGSRKKAVALQSLT